MLQDFTTYTNGLQADTDYSYNGSTQPSQSIETDTVENSPVAVTKTSQYDTGGNLISFNTVATDAGQVLTSTAINALTSQIGLQLGSSNPFENIALQTLSSAALKSIFQVSGNLASSLLQDVTGTSESAIDAGINNTFQAIGGTSNSPTLQNSGGGGLLSSLLVAEAGQALGLTGFAGQVFTTTGNLITGQLISNIASGASLLTGFDPTTLLTSLGINLAGVLEKDLGSSLVNPTNIADAVLTNLGGAIGSQVFGGILTPALDCTFEAGSISAELASTGVIDAIDDLVGESLTDMILPGVGILLGSVIGEEIGNVVYDFLNDITFGLFSDIFGGNVHPWHFVANTFDPTTNEVVFSSDQSKHTDATLRQGTYDLNNAFLAAVNNVIADIGGQVDQTAWNNASHTEFFYDTYFSKYYSVIVRTGQVSSGGDGAYIERLGIENELSQMAFDSGDLVKLKAFDDWKSTVTDITGNSLDTLSSYLQVASDYDNYLANTAEINTLMAAEPDSAFTVGWLATLLQAESLGLNTISQAGFVTNLAGGGSTLLVSTGLPANETSVLEDYSGADATGTITGETITYADGSKTVTGVTAANAAATAAEAHVTSIQVSDSAANVLANLASLQTLAATGQLTSISLTDSTTPTLAITAAQFTADATALSTITSAYNESVSAVTASNASSVAAGGHVISFSVADTSANVIAKLPVLESLATGTQLASITLTDSSTPTIALSATAFAADTAVLSRIASAYNVTLSAVPAGSAATLAVAPHVVAMTISDTAANVLASIGSLEPLAVTTMLSSITLTNTSKPALTVAAALAANNVMVFRKIVSAYTLVVSDTAAHVVGNLSGLQTLVAVGKLTSITLTDGTKPVLAITAGQAAADAATLGKIVGAYSVTVSDTTANVLANLASLQTLAAANVLTSITLTDSATPTLTITATQYTADATALARIASAYKESITGVAAGKASGVAANTHVTSFTVSDTAANVMANITSLEALAAGPQLSSIALTDSTKPTITLSAAQAASDLLALKKIGSAYTLIISDSAANVLANLSALQTLAAAAKLTSITLTDATTPTLALTAAQFTAGGTAVSKISSPYNETVSGVLAANAVSVAGGAHVTSITVVDKAANIMANIAALQTLAAGTKLASLTLTDSPAATLTLTSAQLTGDVALLGKIISPYFLATTTTGLTKIAINSIAGGSQVWTFNPAPLIANQVQYFTGANGTGTNTSTIINWTAAGIKTPAAGGGASQLQTFTGLPAGISEKIQNYSSANATGAVKSTSYIGTNAG